MQVPFDWTSEMGRWFDSKTAQLNFKSIAFATLVYQAEGIWGYRAPPQEVLENKIKSRDAARKRGATVRWILQYQAEKPDR